MIQKFLPILFLVLSLQSSSAQTVKLLKDINQCTCFYGSGERNVIEYKGILYFTAKEKVYGSELYKYDGNDVTLVKDINAGIGDSKCENFMIVNDILIFTANNGVNGVEWWTTDGSEGGTVMVKDIFPGAGGGVQTGSSDQSFYNDGKVVYFSGGTTDNYELWKTDGTTAGTVLVKNIASDLFFIFGSYPDNFVKFKGEIYFNTRNGLHKTNGTEAGTVLIKNSLDFKDLFNYNDQYILMIKGYNLWRTDGTNAGTIQVKSLGDVTLNWNGNRFTQLGNIVLFPGSDAATGEELWKTDGTEAGTQIVVDLTPGTGGSGPQNQVVLKGKYYYKGGKGASGAELFVSDGTDAGTKLFYEFQTGSQGGFSLPTEIITDGNLLYMNAGPSFQKHLWISDGTVIGTKEIKINSSSNPFPFNFYKFGNKLFFYADSDALGYEPYIVEFPNTVIDNDNDGFASDVDCDDTNAAINPGAVEICDGKDNNCNGSVDEGLAQFTFYEDKDNDGFGNLSVAKTGCSNTPPTGFVTNSTDCNDNNALIKPSATEVCDGLDNNCNGNIDEGLPQFTFYEDKDKDGFGNATITKTGCSIVPPTGYVTSNTDCNDTNANINPSATDIANNGIDEDCNGSDFISSVYDVYASKISIKPNPASTTFSIDHIEGKAIQASLYTSTGILLKKLATDSSNDISELSSGVYFIYITTNDIDLPLFKKLVISR